MGPWGRLWGPVWGRSGRWRGGGRPGSPGEAPGAGELAAWGGGAPGIAAEGCAGRRARWGRRGMRRGDCGVWGWGMGARDRRPGRIVPLTLTLPVSRSAVLSGDEGPGSHEPLHAVTAEPERRGGTKVGAAFSGRAGVQG